MVVVGRVLVVFSSLEGQIVVVVSFCRRLSASWSCCRLCPCGSDDDDGVVVSSVMSILGLVVGGSSSSFSSGGLGRGTLVVVY